MRSPGVVAVEALEAWWYVPPDTNDLSASLWNEEDR